MVQEMETEFNVPKLMREYRATETEVGAALGLMYLIDPKKKSATVINTSKRQREIYGKIAQIEELYKDEIGLNFKIADEEEKALRKECRTIVKKLCTDANTYY